MLCFGNQATIWVKSHWVVAGTASGPIMRRADRAGEAKVNRGADEPTQATFDIACGRQRERTRHELIVREPPAGGLGERCRKGRAVVLVEGGSMAHKGVEVQGRELLAGKRYAVSAHSSSSSQRGYRLAWNCYGASYWLIGHARTRADRQYEAQNSSTAYRS